MSEFITREEFSDFRQEQAGYHQQTLDAIAASETRINQRTDQFDTRVNGRIKKLEEEQEIVRTRLDAAEAWMRAKEVVSDFFVNKTKNPLVIFLLGMAISLGGVFIADRNKNETINTTNNNGGISCETRLANLNVSLEGELITKEYYDIQFERIKTGDC